ncbi:MAG: indole-3-glycerol phosphate synthase TrpC [Clostridia bacterium]|nr:indole-3-glycerol phosphate synthase TrpC [Clostridia bacterium]
MDNILGTILRSKYEQLPILREAFDKGCFGSLGDSNQQGMRSFRARLDQSDQMQVIAEIKRGSPSKGLFAPDLDVKAQAAKYDASGVGAISVLTDKHFFHGGFEDLQRVRSRVSVPVLCKDFIVDEIQIDIARVLGADIILLIAAAHTKKRLIQLRDYALKIGLEVLLEVHNNREMDVALSIGHDLIGVNNRNLKTFHTDIQTSLNLSQRVKDTRVHLISESGIQTREDVEKLAKAGFKGVLVGESLIRDGIGGNLIDHMTKVAR